MRPTVSVIIPCYDLGAYLDEAVDSVLGQTYQDFEIIVIDDGSTDPATRSLLANYQRPKTRLIALEHGGLASARNAGIAAAAGSYLCALDADDRLEPSYLEKAVRVLEDNSSVTFASSWLRTFGEEDWEWKPDRCDLPTLLWEDTVLTAALVRREAVVAVGGYDTSMPVQGDEDWDLWLTLVEKGCRGVIIPEVLFHYRRRKDSMSTVCWYGSGHLPLASYRIAKHAETYRTHLTDVLLHQDAETAALLRHNDELERHLTSELEPAIAARQSELAVLRSRLASMDATPRGALEQRLHELESALERTSAEATALRRSMSWRVTAPLRGVYGRWLRWKGSA
jgi:glycosyltransferase involved in cell wall biosynthesis